MMKVTRSIDANPVVLDLSYNTGIMADNQKPTTATSAGFRATWAAFDDNR